MFDLGIQELIVIFVVALLVFGPKRLPELARTMGKGFGQLRRAMFDIKAEVEREIDDETGQIKHDLPDWKQEYPFNQAPAEGKTDDIKGSNRKEYESDPKPETVVTGTDGPEKKQNPEESPSTVSPEEAKDA